MYVCMYVCMCVCVCARVRACERVWLNGLQDTCFLKDAQGDG